MAHPVLAAQLYTVREFTQTAEGFTDSMRKIREMGYTAVQVSAIEYSRRFGPGQIVDFEELIGDGLTLGESVRPGAFEVIKDSKSIGEERKP